MLGTILLVLLIVALIASIPTWPYSRGWGYFPSGLLLIVLIVFILALMGLLPFLALNESSLVAPKSTTIINGTDVITPTTPAPIKNP